MGLMGVATSTTEGAGAVAATPLGTCAVEKAGRRRANTVPPREGHVFKTKAPTRYCWKRSTTPTLTRPV